MSERITANASATKTEIDPKKVKEDQKKIEQNLAEAREAEKKLQTEANAA